MMNCKHIKFQFRVLRFLKSFHASFFAIIFILLSSCKGQIEVDLKKKKTNSSLIHTVSVSNVEFLDNKVVITGSNLNTVAKLNLKEVNSQTALVIDSQNSNSIVARTLNNVTFVASQALDLVLSDAQASTTFTINFSLCDSLLGGKKISCATPDDHDVLAYSASQNKWVPKSVSGLNYQGTWDANDPIPGAHDPGDYYIVSAAGPSHEVGDWIVYNGSVFEKIENSQAVLKVFGRTGDIQAVKGDYDLNKLGDVNLTVAPTNNQVLKYNGSQWVAGNILLTETDPNVAAFAKTAPPTCLAGEVLSSNGVTLTCVTDSSGGTAYTGVMNRLVVTDGSTGALTTSAVTSTEAGYLSGVTGAIQTQIDGKLNAGSYVDWSTGAGIQTIDPSRLNLGSGNAGRAVATNGSGFIVAATATSTELNYLVGVTSSIQSQINAKLSSESDPNVSAFAKTVLPTCSAGQVLSSNGVSFSCVTDNSGAGSYTGTMNRVVLTDGATGALTTSNVTNTEINYLSGVTSAIQTQLNSKLSSFTETDPNVSAFAKSALPTCSTGQVLSSNGTSFSCVTDNSGAGAFTGTTNRVIVSDGSTGSLTTSSVTTTELNYLTGITSAVQSQLNGKLDSSSFVDWSSSIGVQTINPSRLSLGVGNASKAVVTNASGFIVAATASSTELNYLTGVTSSIQTQLNAKLSSYTETDPSVSAFAKTALPTCSTGQVLSSNGTALGCVTDDSVPAYTGTTNRVVLTNATTGALTTSSVTNTEVGYLSGVTSGIQTQLNAKQATITTSTALTAGSLETNLQSGISLKPFNTGIGQTGEFRFYELVGNGSNYTGFKSPDMLNANILYTLPATVPTNGQVLSSTAAGVMSWIDIPSAPVSSVNTKTGAVVLTTSDISEGTGVYHTAARVLATTLASLSTATNAAITAADSILVAMGKLQAQISGQATTLNGKADTTNLTQSITASNITVTTINATPVPDLSKMVANEGGATSVQIGSLSARPAAAAGNTGRMYVANDSGNEAIYVSTGSAWIKVASNGVQATVSIANGGTGATSFTSNKAVVVNASGNALVDGPSIDDTTAVAATLVKRGPAGEVVGQYITPTTTVTENATCTVAIGTIAKDASGNLLTCQ